MAKFNGLQISKLNEDDVYDFSTFCKSEYKRCVLAHLDILLQDVEKELLRVSDEKQLASKWHEAQGARKIINRFSTLLTKKHE